MIDNWISDCPADFEDGAFTDMAIKGNLFGLSGNTSELAESIQAYIDELVERGILKESSGWFGTVYWRAEQ